MPRENGRCNKRREAMKPRKLPKEKMRALVGKHVMVTAGRREWLGYCDDEDEKGLIVYGLLGAGYQIILWRRRVREATPEEITQQGFTKDEHARLETLRDDLLNWFEAAFPLVAQYAKDDDGYHVEIHPSTGIQADGEVGFEPIKVDLSMLFGLLDESPDVFVDPDAIYIDGSIDDGTTIRINIFFEPDDDKPTYQVTATGGWRAYSPPQRGSSPNPSLN